MVIEKLKIHKSPGIDQIAVELVHCREGKQYVPRYINLLILCGIKRTCVGSVDCVSNLMAHAQKPDFVFRQKGQSI